MAEEPSDAMADHARRLEILEKRLGLREDEEIEESDAERRYRLRQERDERLSRRKRR